MGSRWRLIHGIEGEVYTATPATEIAFRAGKVLAQFHSQLKNYTEELKPTLPMFRYDEVLNKLIKYEPQFLATRDPKVIQAFTLLKDQFPKLLLPKNLPEQIIHTDPKITNFLFNIQDQGICMIDLDTIQKLSPLYDIGDCVRSLCGQSEDNPNNVFDKERYEAIIKGYLHVEQTAFATILSDTEKALIPQACQLIMLGLASRFLNDYIDDNYFGWDETRYTSRKDHNLARAIGQIALWHSMKQQA
ncbi:aminoglycoside phosphotransferase family protein [bacterium]|nr:MAG: aminoglycoside phosphotransferase family protein [bacterium]